MSDEVTMKMIKIGNRSIEELLKFRDENLKVLEELQGVLKKNECKNPNEVLGFLAGTFAGVAEAADGGPPVKTISIVIEGYSMCMAALISSGVVKEVKVSHEETGTVH